MKALQLLIHKYENQIECAQFNIGNLVNNPVGVAEHPDILETIEAELAKVAEASDLLEAALVTSAMLHGEIEEPLL